MKALFLFISLLMIPVTWADEVKLEINPRKPVVGEVFQAIFRIVTDSDEEPAIHFTPHNVEVIGKNNQGISTSSIYANGRLMTTREMIISYDLAATSSGTGYLRDITVQLGSKTLRHTAVTFNILKEPEVAADVFVMAHVPKKKLFLGEGIVVRYYLYSKVPVSNLDVKKYPKLNNFLKRFLQEPERSERVTVDGQLYLRNQIYGAKLFAEKVGKLKVDPIYLSATVVTSRAGDPFGAFGLGREMRTKSLSSETVNVEVLPLPEPIPPHFTGLVGKHDFDLQVGNNRLIVNEPLEVKLTVAGGGAMENLEAPTILKHPELEEFETNGDLKIMDADQATKVFDYTFLAKAPMKIPTAPLVLSYFDPDTMKYVPVELKVPEIVVAGTAQPKKERSDDEDKEPEGTVSPNVPEVPETLTGPIVQAAGSWRSWLGFLNFGLAGVAMILALSLIIRKEKLPKLTSSTVPKVLKQGQFDLGEFTRWMAPLILKTGKSPATVIKDLDLRKETKTYFIDLLNSNDYKDYSANKGQLKFSYKADCFKELDRYIQSATNENTSRPS